MMQREDVERRKVDTSREAVERVAAFCEQFSLNIPATLRALLDRAESAEAEVKAGVAERRCLDYRIRKQREELARLQTAQKVAQEFCREKNEATKRAERAEAERDAALAAGQESMRERAAAKLDEMAKGMRRIAEHPDANADNADALALLCEERGAAIRALPINPRP